MAAENGEAVAGRAERLRAWLGEVLPDFLPGWLHGAVADGPLGLVLAVATPFVVATLLATLIYQVRRGGDLLWGVIHRPGATARGVLSPVPAATRDDAAALQDRLDRVQEQLDRMAAANPSAAPPDAEERGRRAGGWGLRPRRRHPRPRRPRRHGRRGGALAPPRRPGPRHRHRPGARGL